MFLFPHFPFWDWFATWVCRLPFAVWTWLNWRLTRNGRLACQVVSSLVLFQSSSAILDHVKSPLKLSGFKTNGAWQRSRKSEVGSWKSEVGSRKSEVGSRKSEVGSGKWEVRSGKWEVRSLTMQHWVSTVRNQKSGVRTLSSLKSEVWSMKSEAGRSQDFFRGTHNSPNRGSKIPFPPTFLMVRPLATMTARATKTPPAI